MIRRAGALLGAALLALGASPALAGPCDAVRGVRVAGVTFDTLTEVGPTQPFAPPLPDAAPMTRRFCRIEGRIEREIGFELWLPEPAAWNRRLLTGGVGGQAGTYK